MAFDLNFGSISNILTDLFVMSLQNGDTRSSIPCSILELSEHQTNTIPQAPQDNNSYIADTIFKQPLQVTLRVFVYGRNFDAFEVAVREAQYGLNGFIINGVNKTYTNMRWIDKGFIESAKMVGGVEFTVTFQESILVQSYNQTMSVDKVKKIQDSQKVESGNKTALSSSLFEAKEKITQSILG